MNENLFNWNHKHSHASSFHYLLRCVYPKHKYDAFLHNYYWCLMDVGWPTDFPNDTVMIYVYDHAWYDMMW